MVTPIEFLRSNAPAVQARRFFWTKLVVVYLWIAILIAVAAIFESWFRVHQFVGVIIAVVAMSSVIAIGAAWHFNVPCPYCGLNINLTKDTPWRPPLFVPSSCPNCGANLEEDPPPRMP